MTIKVRDYEVRLTRTKDERRQVRQLRYAVIVEEEGADASEEQRQLREEYDSYDRFADYMAVFHGSKIVATYRVIDRAAAEQMGGFYTETEYNLTRIKKVRGNIAEMSRACVAAEYRDNSLVMRMLWAGLGEYIAVNKIKVLFGVASWVGTDSTDAAHALSYLYYNHMTKPGLRATVLSENFAPGVNPKLSQMNILPQVFVNEQKAHKQMTPLVKGFLRLGGTVGRGVFMDKNFNTYDIFVLLQTKDIADGYQRHFLGNESAFDNLEIKDGAIKTFGKIMLLPVTGPFKVLRSIAGFMFRDDEEALYIQDTNKGKEE